MADTMTPTQRSLCMSKIRSRNTKPEMIVRSWLHASGYRFRLNNPHLPGKPDVILRKYCTVIMINGCFWHHHKNCQLAYTPKSNIEYWENRFSQNENRDAAVIEKLSKMGWRVLVVWECEIRAGSYKDKLIQGLICNQG